MIETLLYERKKPTTMEERAADMLADGGISLGFLVNVFPDERFVIEFGAVPVMAVASMEWPYPFDKDLLNEATRRTAEIISEQYGFTVRPHHLHLALGNNIYVNLSDNLASISEKRQDEIREEIWGAIYEQLDESFVEAARDHRVTDLDKATDEVRRAISCALPRILVLV